MIIRQNLSINKKTWIFLNHQINHELIEILHMISKIWILDESFTNLNKNISKYKVEFKIMKESIKKMNG